MTLTQSGVEEREEREERSVVDTFKEELLTRLCEAPGPDAMVLLQP